MESDEWDFVKSLVIYQRSRKPGHHPTTSSENFRQILWPFLKSPIERSRTSRVNLDYYISKIKLKFLPRNASLLNLIRGVYSLVNNLTLPIIHPEALCTCECLIINWKELTGKLQVQKGTHTRDNGIKKNETEGNPDRSKKIYCQNHRCS